MHYYIEQMSYIVSLTNRSIKLPFQFTIAIMKLHPAGTRECIITLNKCLIDNLTNRVIKLPFKFTIGYNDKTILSRYKRMDY